MSAFSGSLRIEDTDDVVEAVFEVTEHGLSVSSGGERLGTWPLQEIELDDTGTEIYMALGGEEVIVNMRDRDAFVAELEPPKKSKAKHVRASRQKPRRSVRELGSGFRSVARLFDRDRWRDWLSDRLVRWVIASVTVIIVALFALFATGSLGMILVLIGMVALVVAALAVSEDLNAVSWIPGEVSETTLVVAGAISMLIGGGLIILG
jgi:hypothetical protein